MGLYWSGSPQKPFCIDGWTDSGMEQGHYFYSEQCLKALGLKSGRHGRKSFDPNNNSKCQPLQQDELEDTRRELEWMTIKCPHCVPDTWWAFRIIWFSGKSPKFTSEEWE